MEAMEGVAGEGGGGEREDGRRWMTINCSELSLSTLRGFIGEKAVKGDREWCKPGVGIISR